MKEESYDEEYYYSILPATNSSWRTICTFCSLHSLTLPAGKAGDLKLNESGFESGKGSFYSLPWGEKREGEKADETDTTEGSKSFFFFFFSFRDT